MQRIMIIGGPGSGKSTLARQLGGKLNLPVVHIDPMFWAPGWVQRDPAQTLAMIDAAAAQDRWVFEGNRADHYAGRAKRADLIVFLDLPRVLRLWRILKRRILFHGRTRPEMPVDCPERLDVAFLVEVWHWDRRKGLGLLALMQARTRTLHLTSLQAVRDFLADPGPK